MATTLMRQETSKMLGTGVSVNAFSLMALQGGFVRLGCQRSVRLWRRLSHKNNASAATSHSFRFNGNHIEDRNDHQQSGWN